MDETANDGASLELGATLTSTGGSGDRETITRRLGRYEIVEELGRGGMGIVYRAWDPQLARHVALKLLLSDSPAARERLLREARSAAQLQHPNIVTVFEVGEVDGQAFIAMEYIAGGTLTAWLRHDRSLAEIDVMFQAAGEALCAAHRGDFIHRDFKPDNCLIDDAGRVRVTDFGLVTKAGTPCSSVPSEKRGGQDPQLTRTGTLLGTPLFMSPEQHRGESVDVRTDQFAFAVSLWYALYGEFPFCGQTYDELADAISDGSITEVEGSRKVPRHVETALRRALSPGAEDRFPSMEELLAAIRPTPTRRRSAAVLLIAAMATIIVVGLTIRRSEAPRSQRGTVNVAPPTPQRTLTQRRLTALDGSRELTGIAISRDAFFYSTADGQAFVVRGESGPALLSPDANAHYQVMDAFADGRRVLVASSNANDEWSLLVHDSRSGKHTKLAEFGTQRDALVSPDERTVLIQTKTSLVLLSVDSSRQRVLTKAVQGAPFRASAWSPDARRIVALVGKPGGEHTLDVVDAATGERRTLLRSRGFTSSLTIPALAWPDAHTILYATNRANRDTELMTINPRADVPSRPTRLFLWSGSAIGRLRVNRENKAIAFFRIDHHVNVDVVDRKNKSRVAFTTAPAIQIPVAWLPERGVVYASSADGASGLVVQSAPGVDAERLFQEPYRVVTRHGGDLLLERGGVLHRWAPGTSEPVALGPWERRDDTRCASKPPHRCLTAGKPGHGLRLSEFDPSSGKRGRLVLESSAYSDWDISPDGKSVLVANNRAPIREIELTTGRSDIRYRAPDRASVLELRGDGHDGFFVSGVGFDKGWQYGVGHVDKGGHLRLLTSSPNLLFRWLVPSPDGSRLAVGAMRTNRDAWVLNGL